MPEWYRGVTAGLLMMLVLLLVACQPSEEPALPTLVSEITELPSETPPLVETTTATARPAATLAPTQQLILGRFASDPAKIGYLRVIHAAPDTPPVDIYVDTANLASNISFQEATGRTNVIAGDYTVYVTERGVNPTDEALTQLPVSLKVGQSFMLVLSGVPGAIMLGAYEESTEPLEEGKSRVNFIHAVPFAPTVKAQANGIDLSPLFDFGQQSGNIVVSAGQTTLTFASSEQVLATYSAELFPRTGYTLMMTGRSDALGQLSALVYNTPVSGLTMMRVINMSPSPVDVYLDGSALAQNVAYATASDWSKRNDGTQSVSVFATGADPAVDTPLLQNIELNAVAGDDLALILFGTSDEVRLLPFKEDLSPLTPGTARIVYLNAVPDVPVVQVGNGSSIREDIGRVGYAQASTFFPMDAGDYRIFWQRADDVGGTVEDIDHFKIDAGLVYLYMMTGNSASPVFLTEAVPTAEEVLALPTGEGGDTDTAPSATRKPVTRIRFVNAIDEAVPVDVVINGQPVVTGLPYGQGGTFMEVPAGSFPVTLQPAGGLPAIRTYNVADPVDYTVFIYGPNYDPQLQAINDGLIYPNPQAVTLRLINLGRVEDLTVGLVESPASDTTTPPLPLEPGVTTSAPMIPIGTAYLISSVASLRASDLSPTTSGVHDLIISDNRTGLVAQQIRGFNFEPGAHYDVVVTYPPALNVIQVFLLRYPG